MYVSKIKVSGFRSFVDEVTIDDLNKVNIFVGKNAMGKTNVLEIFLLLRGLVEGNLYRPTKDFISINKKTLSLSLEFTLEEDERKKYIGNMFQQAKIKIIDIIQSNFLKKITYQLNYSEEGVVNEVVSTSNIINGELKVWVQSLVQEKKGTSGYIAGISLSETCKSINKIENINQGLEKRAVFAGPKMKILADIRKNDILSVMIKEFYINIDWLPPIRQAHPQKDIEEILKLDTTGSNLAPVWKTIVNESPEELVKILEELKKVSPYIVSINAKVRENQAFALIKETNGYSFDFSNISSGFHQASIVITKIMGSPKGGILLIEEPELHLHASAQRAMRQLVETYSHSSQFFITTHSTIFANANSNSNTYLVTKKGLQSNIKRVKEPDEMKFIKWELGHSNTDLYGFNLIAFIEGDSEDKAFPIIAESLGCDLVQEGIKLINVKGNGKATKIQQYLEYLRDSDTIPFVIMDGNSEVKQKIEDWERTGLLPNGHHRIWDMEFEDLYSLDLIAECCTGIGYTGVTVEKLEEIKGSTSVVHAIKRILHDSDQKELDKPELAVRLANRISREKQPPYEILKEMIEELRSLSEPQS